jgi:predicted NUDIX family NTP pyrophosphohydrolase
LRAQRLGYADSLRAVEALVPKKSAGLLLYRDGESGVEVLLVHPGGPFWAKKDDGAWSIPKGEFGDEEEPLEAAVRECEEEMGTVVTGDFVALEPIRQPSGKVVYAWAVRSEFDPATLRSNSFSMEWPPRSGRQQEFPEVDRAAWLTLAEAKRKITKGQVPLLDQLAAKLGRVLEGPSPGGTGPGHQQRSLFDQD